MNNYQKPQAEVWTGRYAKTPQYRYQQIELLDFTAAGPSAGFPAGTDVGLIGYQCDEGVRRNQGRTGAKEGPDALRQQLGKLPVHSTNRVADLGNIFCENQDMEACQESFSEVAAALIRSGILSIALGGGHDIAYAHFQGVAKALQGSERKKIGIINFDAHFDLRPVEEQPNSGTPFSQIINEYRNADLDVQYLPIGIQQQSNTQELFEIAAQEGVAFIAEEDCTEGNLHFVQRQLERFIARVDALYVTIDLDGFASPFAPGVSATSPFGLTPNFVRLALNSILDSKKLIACDVAELNPSYDIDNITAKLGARLVDYIISYFNA